MVTTYNMMVWVSYDSAWAISNSIAHIPTPLLNPTPWKGLRLTEEFESQRRVLCKFVQG